MSIETTALLLVDVNNAFFEPGGSLYHSIYEKTLKNIIRLLKKARKTGMTIVHILEEHRKSKPDFEWEKLPPHCIEGEHESLPAKGIEIDLENEYKVTKRRFSGFFSTDLDLLLREAGIKRLIIVGVKINVCVRATVQDAFAYGYEVIVPEEAVITNYPNLHEASLEDINRYFGKVLSIEEVEEKYF